LRQPRGSAQGGNGRDIRHSLESNNQAEKTQAGLPVKGNLSTRAQAGENNALLCNVRLFVSQREVALSNDGALDVVSVMSDGVIDNRVDTNRDPQMWL
jgi:hypothetical protein